tara:strand:+ start:172 stop:1317 length:1146 start_codon:yes stop_codon:yes gene_type:complete
MNLLHISTFLQGGAGKMVVDLARNSKARGDQVWVACTKNGVGDYSNYQNHLDELKSLQIPILYLESTFSREHQSVYKTAIELRNYIRKLEIELVHSHAANPSLISLIATSARQRKIPVLQTMHGWGIYKSIEQEKKDVSVMELLDQVIAISMSSKILLRKKGLQNKHCSILYNGILPTVQGTPTLQGDPHLLEIEMLRKKGFSIAGIVGTIDKRKNQKLLIEAVKKLPKELKVKFFLVGEGEETNEIKRLSLKYGISDKFVLTGFQENGEKFIAAFDLLISSSRSEGGPPLSVIEAFAKKTLVLASDTPEHCEAVKDNHTGFLFKNDDPNDLAQCIIQILHSIPSDKIKKNAFQFYMQNFTLNKTFESYLEWYHVLLENKK